MSELTHLSTKLIMVDESNALLPVPVDPSEWTGGDITIHDDLIEVMGDYEDDRDPFYLAIDIEDHPAPESVTLLPCTD